MTQKYSQDEVDQRARDLIADKLNHLIESFDGSDKAAKEILRGLVASQEMGMDTRRFTAALAKKRGILNAA
jgi:hypothetical protein